MKDITIGKVEFKANIIYPMRKDEPMKTETREIDGHTYHKCERCELFRPMVATWPGHVVCMFCLKESD